MIRQQPITKQAFSLVLSVLLLVPVYAGAQGTEKITLLDTFGTFKKGEQFFVFGNLAQVVADSFVIIQVINPNGDLCQIQQLKPLSSGFFLTESVPLKGKICGIAGQYEVKVFYGDDVKNSKFSLASDVVSEKTQAEYFDSGIEVVSQKIEAARSSATSSTFDNFISKFDLIKANPGSYTVSDLMKFYVDLSVADTTRSDFDQINPRYTPAIESALETTSKLVESGSLSFDIAKKVDEDTFAAVFYSRIGDHRTATTMLADVFVSLTNVDPVKVSSTRSLSYAQIEETLLNLMKKTTSIMNRPVKEEIAFIFARGTGPLYVDELDKLVDLLTKARFLDGVLGKNATLYSLVDSKWQSLRESLATKQSLSELLETKDKIDEIHESALLLRQLDKVDRFLLSQTQENLQLSDLIKPEWDNLKSKLQLATSADQILELQSDIEQMHDVIEISSRISKVVEISRQNSLNPTLTGKWEELLAKVDQANSLSEILLVVSEFDNSINSLKDQGGSLSTLKFEYEAMKKKAELQADYENLFLINNALKIINLAEEERQGISKIKPDRLAVLLFWVSTNAPQIKSKIDSYSIEEYKIRATDILQRAKSIENLAELGLRTHRFLPGYMEFAESVKSRTNEARDLVVKNDLNGADQMVRELFEEWRVVSKAYEEEPYGSEAGYSIDELRKIDLRKKIADLSNLSLVFYNSEFEPHSSQFVKLTERASDLVDHGNYVDADLAIKELKDFLVEYLPLKHPRIIFEINYDSENQIWVMQGYVDKPIFDRREQLYLTVYDTQGNVHSTLEFSDTKHGEVFTQWQAPTEPGLYVVTIQYQNAKASQILNVADKTEVVLKRVDLENVDVAREFEEYEEFLERFGGSNYQANADKFGPLIAEIEAGLASKNTDQVKSKLSELERLIERYLPVRSRTAVIDVRVDENQVHISGAVQKTLSFSEDLFIDVYDRKGNLVDEIELKDTESGHFNHVLSSALAPGLYVAQLQYHDIIVSDFFTIK